MKILYQLPSIETVSASRTIYYGYKNAFEDLGHQFKTLTSDDDLKSFLDEYRPDIMFTSLHRYYLKFLDLDYLNIYRKKNPSFKVFSYLPFWKSPLGKNRVTEAPGLVDDKEYLALIKSGKFADIFYNSCEQEDKRMEGFNKHTQYKYHTIPLAADKIVLKPSYEPKFEADISYIGTNLPEKRPFFQNNVFPLKSQYDIKIYGQDWTFYDKSLGIIQKIGQYYNISMLKAARKPKLKLEDEGKIYKSSKISINVHEEYQKKFGGDCNERTFKVPFCGGFEITDDVACIRKYFTEGKEMVIAKNVDDWKDKIDYYMKQKEEREVIVKNGRLRVSSEHTYHNRVSSIIKIWREK